MIIFFLVIFLFISFSLPSQSTIEYRYPPNIPYEEEMKLPSERGEHVQEQEPLPVPHDIFYEEPRSRRLPRGRIPPSEIPRQRLEPYQLPRGQIPRRPIERSQLRPTNLQRSTLPRNPLPRTQLNRQRLERNPLPSSQLERNPLPR